MNITFGKNEIIIETGWNDELLETRVSGGILIVSKKHIDCEKTADKKA